VAGSYEGGCLCGRIRFEAAVGPADVGYCHCRVCQRSSGAPALVWAAFPKAAFAYSKGEPVGYRSSDHAVREFCGRCGTQIVFRDDHLPEVDVNVGAFDAPAALPPRSHIWNASRIPWFDPKDGLPRYEDDGPPRKL
jgi:hypothetical protein